MADLKNDLRASVISTAVFAVVFGLIVACSNGTQTIFKANTKRLVRLVSHIKPVMTGLPSNLNSSEPLMATLFQAQAQASQIQQSFQGGGVCGNGASSTGYLVNLNGATAGFIPLQVPIEPDIHTQSISTPTLLACQGVFNQIGGGVDTISGGTLDNPGTPVYSDGTLTTLIVTGKTVNGNVIRCNDLITTYAVKDQQLVQPYFVIDNNSVVLGIGKTQLPFACNLSIPQGDQAGVLIVQWAKI